MLEARGLIKHLGGRRVVDGVDLVCLPGQIHGLLGPNGAGKTTTLRMLYGFLTPDGGEIRFEGADVREDLEAAKRYIGVCTQDDTFDGDFTVEQNLLVAAEYFRPRPTGLRARVDHLLDRFELRPYARQRPETLSGGYRRRLMLARAIVHSPAPALPRRAHDRPRSPGPRRGVAAGRRAPGGRARDRPHHALHGRGGAAERRAHGAGPRAGRRPRHAQGRAGRLGRRARRGRAGRAPRPARPSRPGWRPAASASRPPCSATGTCR